ncbi:MAG: multicopper oxidase domain-containing protein [Nitrospira sp.]|nr:multicopper oxidase domain-containing protein [Nitrospira sp.]
MTASINRMWSGILSLATFLTLVGVPPSGAIMSSHENHAGHESKVGALQPVHRQAGPTLQDKMSRAIDQIEREVQTKGPFRGASAHAMQQGVLLVAEDQDKVKVTQGGRCPAHAPVRAYDITAINVEITVNRFGDFYPGYMYVLTENVAGVREEEAKNRAARESDDPTFSQGAVSTGLQGDLIQPLVIRANQGDCLRITLRNEIDGEPTNMIINGSQMLVAATGKPATANNPDALVAPGKVGEFEWYIPVDLQEGGRAFHSHATRDQYSLGMLGALIVEPRGSRYLSPFTGEEMKSGWEAMIDVERGSDFREFVIFYHEAGDETFRLLNRKGDMLPQRDAHTDTYRPAARLLNYRSEPHGERLELQAHLIGFADESQGYGSYTFGDPATTIPRSYLGDPAKFRMVGGSEIVHSHHLHGGSIRWSRQPETSRLDPTLTKNGPVKFPLINDTSDRLDVQSIGPSEIYDEVIEGGSGGLQALAGEFVFHCHIPQHYVTGMWGFWRVYNTLQAPGFQTDVMKPLVELPDRKGKMKPAVTSDKLVGTIVDWYGGKKYEITKDKTDWKANPVKVSIKDWVEYMLPPQGLPGKTTDQVKQAQAHDATVVDWKWEGDLALNEPETPHQWANYVSPAPLKRPPILFDPQTGKLAFPWLRPHLGKRPPFAPNHGGAPWLEPFHVREDGSKSTEPARPGEQGPWSLCPENAPRKFFTIHSITLPITLKKATAKTPAIVDPIGMIYVLHEEEEEVRKNPDKQVPLVIRANVYDCVDVIFKNEIPDDARTGWANKINLHPHFFQFDTSASDGPTIGFSYDMSLRAFTMLKDPAPNEGMPLPANTVLTADVKAGASSITVADPSKFHVNIELGVGMDDPKYFEVARIKSINGKTITFDRPLKYGHKKNDIVSVEFIRERWYIDADLGTVYWHDHVFGTDTWGHGLFSALITEPPRSTYHDPVTGKEIRSGPIADIHTLEPVSAHIRGSFREVMMHIMDSNARTAELITTDNPQAKVGAVTVDGPPSHQFPPRINKSPMWFLNGGEATTGSGYSMRVEPLSVRLANDPDPSKLFVSRIHGDPATPLLRAYLGDPIVVRALVGSANEVHTWHVTGHWFPMERYATNAMPRSTIHLVIGERYDPAIPAAGGPQRMAGDYLYYSGRASHFSEGSWGIIRVYDELQKDLKPLPGREEIQKSAPSVCPADAPVKSFNVVAIDQPIRYHDGAPGVMEVDLERKMVFGNELGKMYVLEGDRGKVKAGELKPSPLTLHVNVGDCVKIHLKNEMAKDRAGFHVDMMAFDPKDSFGANVGNNPGDQTIGPGESRTYTYYAHPEYGEVAALIQDWGNVIENPRNGLFGAIIVGPKGSQYRDPVTGEDISLKSSWRADVLVDRTIPGNEHRKNYRDFALMFQDEDNIVGVSFMPYIQQVAGITAVNYRSEPAAWRIEKGCDVPEVFSCVKAGEVPSTPLLQAHVGDPVAIHVLGAFSEQVQLFTIDGHEWPHEPYMKGADQVSTMEFGGSEVINAYLTGGAGGPNKIAGDYIWKNQRPAYANAGQWGLFRVLPVDDRRILPLTPQLPPTKRVEQQMDEPKVTPTSLGSE